MPPSEGYRRFNRVVRRRRQAGECPRAIVAIRNHCLECAGYQQTHVDECTSPQCWLYPYRMGKDPVRKGSHADSSAHATGSLPGPVKPPCGAGAAKVT